MGLSQESMDQILLPLTSARGAWRVPHNTPVPLRKPSRGMPQGLASSVVLAELFLSLVLWKISYLPTSTMVSYVDDLNIACHDAHTLCLVIMILKQFAADFCVVISSDKTVVWGTDEVELRRIAEAHDLSYADIAPALGMEWSTSAQAQPTYSEEIGRIEELKQRLKRVPHLPSPLHVRIQAVDLGCLSLLDFSPLPCVKALQPIKLMVKRALGHVHEAPEILFNAATTNTLDPYGRWFVAALRMWVLFRKDSDGKVILNDLNMKRRHSRLVCLVLFCKKWGWVLTPQSLSATVSIDLTKPWETIRPPALKKRRPILFEGICELNVKQHRKLLRSLSSYQGSVMLRIWGGCALTRAHRNTIDPSVSAACDCGHESQSLSHLLYECPCVPAPPLHIRAWSQREACFASALLCPPLPQVQELATWREVCMRAIAVLTNLTIGDSHVDWKNHEVTSDMSLSVVFCVKCMVSRSIRDHRHIAAKPCPGEMLGNTCAEGDYIRHSGHILRCKMATWKSSSLRPKLCCVLRPFSCWPSSFPPRVPCGG